MHMHIGNRHGGWTISLFTDLCFLAIRTFRLMLLLVSVFRASFLYCCFFVLPLINLVSFFIGIIFILFLSCYLMLSCCGSHWIWIGMGDGVNVLIMCGCPLCLLSLSRLICFKICAHDLILLLFYVDFVYGSHDIVRRSRRKQKIKPKTAKENRKLILISIEWCDTANDTEQDAFCAHTHTHKTLHNFQMNHTISWDPKR